MKLETTIDASEMKKIIRDYCEQLCTNKLDNLEEMGKILEKYNLSRLNQEEIESSNKPVTNKNI